jgi:hypothetical protein
MKAIDRPFNNIINGTSQFVIPVFQRDYTWQAETQCAQLWRDVLSPSMKSALSGTTMTDKDHRRRHYTLGTSARCGR